MHAPIAKGVSNSSQVNTLHAYADWIFLLRPTLNRRMVLLCAGWSQEVEVS